MTLAKPFYLGVTEVTARCEVKPNAWGLYDMLGKDRRIDESMGESREPVMRRVGCDFSEG